MPEPVKPEDAKYRIVKKAIGYNSFLDEYDYEYYAQNKELGADYIYHWTDIIEPESYNEPARIGYTTYERAFEVIEELRVKEKIELHPVEITYFD
jgi:hypothetical protein